MLFFPHVGMNNMAGMPILDCINLLSRGLIRRWHTHTRTHAHTHTKREKVCESVFAFPPILFGCGFMCTCTSSKCVGLCVASECVCMTHESSRSGTLESRVSRERKRRGEGWWAETTIRLAWRQRPWLVNAVRVKAFGRWKESLKKTKTQWHVSLSHHTGTKINPT